MRDAFGGAFMIKLLVVFIVIYVGFTAIALNYAKAFKVKNKVIQYLEDNEIADTTALDTIKFNRYIEETIVEEMDYKVTRSGCSAKEIPSYCKNFYCENGIEINQCQVDATDSNKEGTYYTVTTAFGWEIPFLNVLLRLNDEDDEATSGLWTITGETRTIVNKKM